VKRKTPPTVNPDNGGPPQRTLSKQQAGGRNLVSPENLKAHILSNFKALSEEEKICVIQFIDLLVNSPGFDSAYCALVQNNGGPLSMKQASALMETWTAKAGVF